jgi:excinuclease ABC subunit C
MADIKKIVSILPSHPGVYQFYGSDGTILYVGKAKNLKYRVSSYFTKLKYESFKTKKLASQVTDIKHIIVETESDALLLENNLIKQFQPKYNILLKDDKTFPWICIKKERFPRVFSTRNRLNDGSEYFGPYTSAVMVRTLINLIRQIYQVRTCNLKLSPENIENKKLRVCLEYHIGNCLAPCINKQTHEEYQITIKQVKDILKGDIQEVQDYLKNHMIEMASKQLFEEAELLKKKHELLQRYKSKSTIVNPKINNVDVFSYYERNNKAYVNFIKIINGAIVQSHTVEITRKLDETKEDLLAYAILDIREKVNSNANKSYIPFEIIKIPGISFSIPKIGDKKKLLDLSERNAVQYALQVEKKKQELSGKYRKPSDKLIQLQTDLRLKELPKHIECFDNSNIQGTSPVAACVVFRNGKPASKEYRHYHIKTVKGANDFASMEEIIFRRYKRLLEEEKKLPQLIVIDGGKGQLSAAVNSLKKLKIYGQVAILGIAKKLEELYFPGDSIPLYLDKNSSSLKIIQHLRNEAHRFGITFHRNVRSKKLTKSELEDIEGVGEKSIEKLLKHFTSVNEIASKSIDELSKAVTKNIAQKVYNFYHYKKFDKRDE